MIENFRWRTCKTIGRAVFVVALLNVPLAGCVGMVIGAGATAGVAALEERTAKVIAKDTTIATEIRLNLLNANEKLMTGIGVEVYQSHVLLTGVVPTEALRADAVQLAWKVAEVNDVYNEIQIADASLIDFASDSLITAKLTSTLTFDRDVQAINYNIETVNGTVYLIGMAQSQQELDRVLAHTRGIGGVQRIINHMLIKKAGS